MDPEIVPSMWPHFPVIPVISHNHNDKARVLDRWILGNYHGMQPHGVTGVMPHVNECMQRAFSKNCLHKFNWYPAVQAQMDPLPRCRTDTLVIPHSAAVPVVCKNWEELRAWTEWLQGRTGKWVEVCSRIVVSWGIRIELGVEQSVMRDSESCEEAQKVNETAASQTNQELRKDRIGRACSLQDVDKWGPKPLSA
ncbi:hypothetical protein B0H10DRAFT_1959566 [Mycena sp. CBHHK59/15]|nr:hypothetical protein B0H10DRAFT_1959566 [Mycena sp. CBHHK59/15]